MAEKNVPTKSRSVKKIIRKIERRTGMNRSRRSRIRTLIRQVEEAISSGDQAAAGEAFKAMQPAIMRGAQKGILPKKTASRKVSRLSARIHAMQA